MIGVTSAIRAAIGRAEIAFRPSAPPTVSTAGGTPAVVAPPTVAPPPSAVDLVNNQLSTSTQLQENTFTGSGTGAGNSSVAVTQKKITNRGFLELAALAALLLVAVMFHRRS